MTDLQLKCLLNDMTLEEKAGQLSQLPVTAAAEDEFIATGPMNETNWTEDEICLAGSLIGMQGAEVTAKAVRKITQNQPHHIPPMVMTDAVHGYRTIFPIPLALGCTFDREIAYDMGRTTAKEATAAGIHVTFAPMVDVSRDARWGRMMESPGETPCLIGEIGSAIIKGFHGDGIGHADGLASCIKHFAAYGLSEAGQEYSAIDVSKTALYNTYFPPFEACIKAGADAVMPAFVGIERTPCVCNEWLLHTVLRDKMKFEGFTISDWLDIAQLISHGVAQDSSEAAELSLKAGVDIDMLSLAYQRALPELVRKGIISMEVLDEAVLHVLEAKAKLGLFDHPVRNDSIETQNAVFAKKEHREKAYMAALESCVLLKNENILPLSRKMKVALLGDYANSRSIHGAWSADVDPQSTATLAEAFEQSGIEATDPEKADVILCAIGEKEWDTGENTSKLHPILDADQILVLQKARQMGKPVIAIVFMGRSLILTEALKYCDALLCAWFPGCMGAYAIRDLLLGDKNPSGHLSVTLPRCIGQMPIYHDRLTTCRPDPSQNHYIDGENSPLFPFGFGLSYSEFALSDARVIKNGYSANEDSLIEVTVKNTSAVKGRAVVQVYARINHAHVIRPKRRLCAFEACELEPNEAKRLAIPIKNNALSLYDSEGNELQRIGTCALAVGFDSTQDFNLELS